MRETQKYSTLTRLILLLFICVNSFFVQNAFAQKDPEVIAKEYFELGQFEEALPHFKDLVHLYPKDQILNYYYAACLVETEIFTPETKTTIQNAIGEKTPAKIFYYQAQVFHADNDFQKALSFYQRFLDEAKRKTTKSTRVDELIELCQQNINPFFTDEEPEVVEEIKEEPIEEVKPVNETKKAIEIPSNLKDSIIHFQLTPTIRYLKIDQFKNDESAHAFVKGWLLEQNITKALEKTNQLREEYSKASEDEKLELVDQILQLEKETYTLNIDIEQFYLEARQKEISFWDNANPDEISEFQRKISILEDSIASAAEERIASETNVVVPIKLPEEKVNVEVQETPQQYLNKVVYRIQIGAYRKSPPQWVQSLFKKLSVIRRIDNYKDEKGITVYTVGELSSFNDALKMQAQVRQEGVKDAFVAAYKNGERIPVKEARKLTN